MNTLDLALTVLIALLAFKGAFNGIRRELTQLVAIVGAIFVASRSAAPLSRWLQTQFSFHNQALLQLIAFLTVLIGFWGVVTFIGKTIQRHSPETPSRTERILGYFTALVKYFFILSVIVTVLFQSRLFHDKYADQISKSLLYPILHRCGNKLLPPVKTAPGKHRPHAANLEPKSLDSLSSKKS